MSKVHAQSFSKTEILQTLQSTTVWLDLLL